MTGETDCSTPLPAKQRLHAAMRGASNGMPSVVEVSAGRILHQDAVARMRLNERMLAQGRGR
jgi:hypothetical protein